MNCNTLLHKQEVNQGWSESHCSKNSKGQVKNYSLGSLMWPGCNHSHCTHVPSSTMSRFLVRRARSSVAQHATKVLCGMRTHFLHDSNFFCLSLLPSRHASWNNPYKNFSLLQPCACGITVCILFWLFWKLRSNDEMYHEISNARDV